MSVKFTLFDISNHLVEAWREAFSALVPEQCQAQVTILQISPIDCIVSPANSFGRFDGGFDQILSDLLAPSADPAALTRAAQSVLHRRWRGYAPPGTCTLIPLSDTPCAANPFSCRFVALCPTMRFPSSVTWHREIVYNCVWSLLVEVDAHNARAATDSKVHPIESVAMTGLGTGIGCISPQQCAKQTALAFAHYHDAKMKPEMWSAMTWEDIENYPLEIRLPSDYH
ncbi:macro domain-like protein [Melanogaster broomeanus]|nr:macro domain-like protein [Melanogaster broomeanus]